MHVQCKKESNISHYKNINEKLLNIKYKKISKKLIITKEPQKHENP